MDNYKIYGLYEKDIDSLFAIYQDALLNSFRSWTDELQSGSPQRTSSQKPIIESIGLCVTAIKKRHLTIIQRNDDTYISDKPFFEFGLSTGNRPCFFVWICVSTEKAFEIFNKYDIKFNVERHF